MNSDTLPSLMLITTASARCLKSWRAEIAGRCVGSAAAPVRSGRNSRPDRSLDTLTTYSRVPSRHSKALWLAIQPWSTLQEEPEPGDH